MGKLGQTSFTIETIEQALAKPLPGVVAQQQMAPQPITGLPNRWQIPPDCRQAAVLLLLYPNGCHSPEAELSLVLTRRPEYAGAHSGQISLPGGRQEGQETLQYTALRETTEEIGVAPETVKIIGQLSPLYTPPSNFCIYPFVGFSCTQPIFQLNAREVAEIIEVPLHLFWQPGIRKAETRYLQNYGDRQIPFFDIFGHKVWGATAMIVNEFLFLLTQ